LYYLEAIAAHVKESMLAIQVNSFLTEQETLCSL